MKITQTFWTGLNDGVTNLNIKAGWRSAEYHWMSWALSCLTLRRQYERVELYTDELGKHILIDVLKLPYTKVHLIFDESFQCRPELFSLAKIKTYSVQDEPFLHVDGDIYLWQPFPKSFSEAGLIAPNLEMDLFFNKEILETVHEKGFKIPDHLKEKHKDDHIYACNAGILGGGDLDFIKRYCEEANAFISKNPDKLELVDVGKLNWLIEQVSLYYLSKKEEVSVSYLFEEPVINPLYEDYWRFSDIPHVKLIHPVGGCKKEAFVLNHLSKRLRLEYPSVYYNILYQCQHIDVENRLYAYFHNGPLHMINGKKKTDLNVAEYINGTGVKRTFARTIHLLHRIDDVYLANFWELSNHINARKQDKFTGLLEEVYGLERNKYIMLSKLNEDHVGIKEHLYLQDMHRYALASRFFFSENWMEHGIELAEGVEVFESSWDVNVLSENNDGSMLMENLDDTGVRYVITLHPNIMNLDIVETRHDGLDAALLSHIGKGNIRALASELTKYFEDDLTIDNVQYQKLLFDTIKRMAFENLVEVK